MGMRALLKGSVLCRSEQERMLCARVCREWVGARECARAGALKEGERGEAEHELQHAQQGRYRPGDRVNAVRVHPQRREPSALISASLADLPVLSVVRHNLCLFYACQLAPVGLSCLQHHNSSTSTSSSDTRGPCTSLPRSRTMSASPPGTPAKEDKAKVRERVSCSENQKGLRAIWLGRALRPEELAGRRR